MEFPLLDNYIVSDKTQITAFENCVVINIMCLISRKTTSENEYYQVAREFENSLLHEL